jgi:7-keto-8-aminopelargonate synthetase-like enzyme
MADNSFEKELSRILALSPDRLKSFHPVNSRAGVAIQTRGKPAVDFTSRDYLGVLESKKVRRAIQKEIEEHSPGSVAPRLSTGTLPAHLRCEDRIARFVGTESSLLFSSRNQAVLSLITSFVTERDLVIAPENAQSPVFDAAYLVGAKTLPFSPKSMRELEDELASPYSAGRRFLFVESLSPLTGELLDLQRIFTLTSDNDTAVLVDESYATGALGIRGAGGVEYWNAVGKPLVIYGELGLGLGLFGGFVAASRNLASLLLQRSKTFQSETPLPAANAIAIETALDEIELLPIQREKLKLLSSRLRTGCAQSGFDLVGQSDAPIVCLRFDKMGRAVEVVEALFSRGYLLEAQSVGELRSEAAVVRAFINSSHSDQQIDGLLQALSEIRPRLED